MEKTLYLQWKAYPDHLMKVFKELGEEGHFADVTLVSDDQVQNKAHKVVLSACSPVLKSLLVNNPHSHPLLYLKGIKQTELQAILNFIYFGEAQILRDRITDFISIAKDLGVKDINQEHEDEPEVNETDSIEFVDFPIKYEHLQYEPDSKKTHTKYSENTTVKLQNRLKASTEERKKYPCPDCNHIAANPSNLKLHSDAKHAGVKYPCPECNYKATQQARVQIVTYLRLWGSHY